MLRAHLIMNPEARGVTPSLQHLMATALEARFKLERLRIAPPFAVIRLVPKTRASG